MVTLEEAVKIVENICPGENIIRGAENNKDYAFWTIDKSIEDITKDSFLVMDIVILVSKEDGSTSGEDTMQFALDAMDNPTYKEIKVSDYVNNPELASKYWNLFTKK